MQRNGPWAKSLPFRSLLPCGLGKNVYALVGQSVLYVCYLVGLLCCLSPLFPYFSSGGCIIASGALTSANTIVKLSVSPFRWPVVRYVNVHNYFF